MSAILSVINNNFELFTQYILQKTVNTTKECEGSAVHFVETKPSALHDVFDVIEHDVSVELYRYPMLTIKASC